jgi:hypothetical protein
MAFRIRRKWIHCVFLMDPGHDHAGMTGAGLSYQRLPSRSIPARFCFMSRDEYEAGVHLAGIHRKWIHNVSLSTWIPATITPG